MRVEFTNCLSSTFLKKYEIIACFHQSWTFDLFMQEKEWSSIKLAFWLAIYNPIWFLWKNLFRSDQNKLNFMGKITFRWFRIRKNMWWTRIRILVGTINYDGPNTTSPITNPLLIIIYVLLLLLKEIKFFFRLEFNRFSLNS